MVWLDRDWEAGSYWTEENSDEKRYFRQRAEEKKGAVWGAWVIPCLWGGVSLGALWEIRKAGWVFSAR